jgi:hypothetical protein
MKSFFLSTFVFSVLIFASAGAASAQTAELRQVPRPQQIVDLIKGRGEQDSAKPVLRMVEPAEGAVVTGSTVRVRLELTGDLRGYKPGMHHETKTGNHIHVILDNQAYEAYYDLDREFELRNVSDGEHTIRVFPSRPWHESYKNAGGFQMVRFTVRKGGADASKPVSTNAGEQMSAMPAEGKEMKASNAGAASLKKPLLTFSRPKGDYKGADADAIMVDFWISGAKLVGDGGRYRVRWTANGSQVGYIDKWEPVWLTGWPTGRNVLKFELVDRRGRVVENGGYNTTVREFTVTR